MLCGRYLNEVESVKFAFEGSSETFNFAEAALLIQGSACIYSKKVRTSHAFGLP